MSNHDDLILQFSDVTGVDPDRARFYLESSAWQLDVALGSFFENDGDNHVESSDEPVVIDNDDDIQEDTQVSPSKTAKQKTSKEKPRFGTIGTLPRDADESEEEEGQAFFAGGSVHSGQQVIGPGKKKKDIVSEMFRSAQEHGGQWVEPLTSGLKKPKAFMGPGYKLGQANEASEVVQGETSSTTDHSNSEVILKLWKEGFTVNDGPLRNYSDPENQEFLQSVYKGEVPHELVREARGVEVHLSMEDHRQEEFVYRKPKMKAFTGKGYKLGSPAPAAIGTTALVDEKDKEVNENQAKKSVEVDDSQPCTTLQIRLADGSRLVARFNLTHTIADVRRYIAIARPQYEHQNFSLRTTFPVSELTNHDQTLVEAGVVNATLFQKLIAC